MLGVADRQCWGPALDWGREFTDPCSVIWVSNGHLPLLIDLTGLHTNGAGRSGSQSVLGDLATIDGELELVLEGPKTRRWCPGESMEVGSAIAASDSDNVAFDVQRVAVAASTYRARQFVQLSPIRAPARCWPTR